MLKDEANVELELLPPYSPVLNRLFHDAQRHGVRPGPADERSRFLIEYVYSHLPNISPRDVRAFSHHCAWGRPGPIDVHIFDISPSSMMVTPGAGSADTQLVGNAVVSTCPMAEKSVKTVGDLIFR